LRASFKRVGRLLPLLGQGHHEIAHARGQAVDDVAHVQPQRDHRLLVAAAAQVPLAREIAHDLGQARLHEAVHVLDVELLHVLRIRLRPVEDLGQALVELRRVVLADGAAAAERPRIRARGRDLLHEQPPIERERAIEIPESGVGVRPVVSAPELAQLR
jgi:hypothetical protein